MARNKVKNSVPKKVARLEKAVTKWAGDSAELLNKRAIESMQKPKSGARNRRTGKNRSAPGESPAIDTRELVEDLKIEKRFLGAKFGPTLERAKFLEKGTKNMLPRPLWEPLKRENLPTLENNLKQVLRGLR